MTVYTPPEQNTLDLIQSCIEEYHPKLSEADVKIDAVFAFNEKADYPVKTGGYPTLAFTKVTPLKQRVRGLSDAEITIDGVAFECLNTAQQRALIDRELYSLELLYDKEGKMKRDDIDRPKLRIKKVDYRLSWFREIALRHGQNSPEVYQAKLLWNNDGKTFFPTTE